MNKRVLRTAALIVCLSPAVLTQSPRGSVGGVVRDESGRTIAAARIVITEEETGKRRDALSDAAGEFTAAQLAPGSYRIEVEREGFRRHIQKLDLFVNQEARVDVVLAAGVRTEQVEVRAAREMVRADSAALGVVIDNLQVLGLPLDGRNFFELTLLAPGILPAAPGSAGSVRGDLTINANGAREDANHFLLDGVYNGDPKLNSYAVSPPVDAIREFEVLSNSYDASFGRNAGAQVSVVLRSGSNRFHGTAYEFFRNSAMDARNFFAAAGESDPAYRRNQFGGSLGGPIRRDRTFFFADYEGRRLDEGITRVTNVPTALERNGDFSRSDPTRPPIDVFTMQPFPGAVIPPNRVHPVGRNIANLYPLPNRSAQGQNYVASPLLTDTEDRFDVRADHSLAEKSELTIRYSFADRTLFEPYAGPTFSAVPGYGTNVPRRGQNVMLGETHTFSSNLINEVRLGFNRVAVGPFHQNQGRSVNRQIGLPELSANARDHGLSFITVTGFSALGDEYNNPQHSVTNTYQVADNVTWSRGRHLARFGLETRILQQNGYRDVQSRGFLNFLGMTGNALAEMLTGFPSLTGGATLDNHQYLRTESYNFFAQDTWRMRRDVTLSLGLRYEFNSPPVDVRDRANLYDPATGSLVQVGTGNVPRGGYNPDRNNWAPRFGFAWTPRGSQTTVLRGGYGVFFDQSALAPGEGLYFNPPYFNFRLYFSLPQYPLTLSSPFPQDFPVPLPPSALTYQRDLRTAYLQQWDFGVQRQLGASRVLEISYAGSKGTKLIAGRDLNQPSPSPAPVNLRPNPRFDDISIIESRSASAWHSLQARFQQRLHGGLTLLASYTLGKSIDNASSFFTSAGDANFPQDSHNVRAERGRSNFDVRQRLSVAYTYDLPFSRARRGWLLSGWQTAGIWTFQTGRPFTVALLADLDNSNTGRSVLGFGANDRPHRLRDGSLAGRSPERWFDTSAFAVPARGSFGNSGRNILDGPGLANVNLSLLKNTSVREGVSVQFRVEAFNVFNRTNFDLPDIFLGSPSFGRINSAQSARRLQMGAKLVF